MKRLIVNADDLGADEARNRGIFEAIDAGVVTSVSLLANGPSFEDAARRIRNLDPGRISPGLHFNLSEGVPVAAGLKLLTGSDGRFPGKGAAQQLLTQQQGPELEAEIQRELSAQITALRDRGIKPNHLDGHQHVHILPAAVRPVIEVMREHGITWIRIPSERAGGFRHESVSPALAEEARFFAGHAEAARALLPGSGVCSTDHFYGLYFKGRLPAFRWLEFLDSIPPGLSELMVHPGRTAAGPVFGPFSAFSTRDRESELEALTDGRFRRAVSETGIEIVPFPEAPI